MTVPGGIGADQARDNGYSLSKRLPEDLQAVHPVRQLGPQHESAIGRGHPGAPGKVTGNGKCGSAHLVLEGITQPSQVAFVGTAPEKIRKDELVQCGSR